MTHGQESSPVKAKGLQVVSADAHGKAPHRVPRRFDRLARLYGEAAVAHLHQARVIIIGLGGVGGFAAEALARSAVGHLTLVDFDEVCATNANRQLQALASTVGLAKVELLAARLRDINPDAQVVARREFYEAANSEALLLSPWPGQTHYYDFVVDCIDSLKSKAHLLVTCHRLGLQVVSAMGAAGKTDPTRVRIADLGDTDVCPMAQQLRKSLRQKHGLPKGRGMLGITAVYSDEERHWPRQLTTLSNDCDCTSHHPRHSQEGRAMIEGSAMFVTGAFGLACASHIVNTWVGDLPSHAAPAPVPARRVKAMTSAEQEPTR